MCGICGFLLFNAPADRGPLEAMIDTLSHRGPDGRGTYLGEGVALGHARLSIIDLSESGSQPMGNEDGSVVCVFNGELYNYQELKQRLQAKGHAFRGTSDTEVIPHLYEEEGEALFETLRGMFAVAVWDERQRRLLLARDRFGIKPLYFAALPEGVVFASEIKGILSDPRVPRRLNLQAIHDYLSLLYIPGPATAFSDIQEVLPGQVLTWDGPHIRRRTFWSVDALRAESAFSEPGMDRLAELIDKAVASQLVADVPLGAMLSGGIDSSLIVESASRQLRAEGRDLPAFTVGFPDPAYDESGYAAEVARACGLEHQVLRLDSEGVDLDLVRRVLLHFDQPFADSSAIPTYLVCREIRHHVKVALSGDGGDEIFGGYERFWRAPAIRRMSRLPQALRRLLTAVLSASAWLSPDLSRQLVKAVRLSGMDTGGLLFALSAYLDEEQKASLYNLSEVDLKDVEPTCRLFKNGDSPKENGTDSFSAFITDNLVRVSLPGRMLRKVDMMSMLTGLEVRVPLLDEELANAGLCLPHALKVQGRVCKWGVRQVAARRLPDRIARKPKWGFNIPLDTWGAAKLETFARETLLGPGSRVSGFLDHKVISTWLDGFAGRSNLRGSISPGGLSQRVYMLLGLELWLRAYNPSWR